MEYLAKKDNLPVSRYTPTLVRGECAAENVYIACVILADLLHTDSAHRNPSQPAFYQAILRLCDQYKDKAEQLPSEAREIIRHFNHKIYSANKYTPFDDCYELRSAVTDSEPKYLWEMMTLAFQTAQGVQYSQIATSLSSIKKYHRWFKLQFKAWHPAQAAGAHAAWLHRQKPVRKKFNRNHRIHHR